MSIKKFLSAMIVGAIILLPCKNIHAEENLIAEYEKAVDIYNLDQQVDWKNLMVNAIKLRNLDPQNVIAFRALVYYQRDQMQIKQARAYCKDALKNKPSTELAIEAYFQLADMYHNEMNYDFKAIKYVNQAISIVKRKYKPAEIDKIVNGNDVIAKDLKLTGKTNTIRELYILKSELEGANPTFETSTEIENSIIKSEKIFNIKYRTDW